MKKKRLFSCICTAFIVYIAHTSYAHGAIITYQMGGTIVSDDPRLSSVNPGDAWSVTVKLDSSTPDTEPTAAGIYDFSYGILQIGSSVSIDLTNFAGNAFIGVANDLGADRLLQSSFENGGSPETLDGYSVVSAQVDLYDSTQTTLSDASLLGTVGLTRTDFNSAFFTMILSDENGLQFQPFSEPVEFLTVTISTIPVPPTFWLFGSGLLGLVGIARRRIAA